MRFIVHQLRDGEDELILNYRELNREVEEVLAFMEKHERRLTGRLDGETVFFSPKDILYVEKVDDRTFAYTMEHVIQLDLSLAMVEIILDDDSFFRCSKSMIINVRRIDRLKSLPSNRIDATMQSGEHILISRTYASDFRKLLRGGMKS